MIMMSVTKMILISKIIFCSMNIFMAIPARGVGASHQTGWTGVVAELINRDSVV
jgi:hypothetical protein